MDENQGYVIRQSVLFDNGRGIALGDRPGGASQGGLCDVAIHRGAGPP